MRTAALLMALLVSLAWSVRVVPAQTTSPSGTNNGVHEPLPDPFYPGLPAKTVKIRYRFSGRFEGQEILAAKKGPKGPQKVREIRCIDTALGLERPVHWWILETPERIVRLDLVNGRKEVHPNLRRYLSRAWSALSEAEKLNLAKNLPSVGTIVGREMRIGVAVADESSFLGLPGIKVALGSGRAWYWAKTDLVIRALGHQGGFSWNKEAIDIIQDQEMSDDMFSLPAGEAGSDRLEVSAKDREWAGQTAERIVALLARPLLGQEDEARTISKKRITYKQAIPWPHPAPPGFRDSLSQYRLNPNWVPYPKPPDQRPWPPPGLGISILKIELQEIATLLGEKMPSLSPPAE